MDFRMQDRMDKMNNTASVMKQVVVLVGAGSIGQAEFLMSSRGRFISGADLLIDGGCTASYWYGDLQYLKATH